VIDARRGDGPRGARDYTFAALVATQEHIEREPETAAAATRAVVAAQRALKADPSLATRAAKRHFPAQELELIAELVRRDAPYYDALISQESVRDLNTFARALGLLRRDARYDEVVATLPGT
jgi:ABC-type nitrate/sulfonate/bicarbonate transport system substrate-binding protein